MGRMSEQETATAYVVQHRVTGHSQLPGKWTTSTDYRTLAAATRRVDEMRQAERSSTSSAAVEWRVLKVSQEVVY